MTTNEVISKLQEIVKKYPEKGEMECCIYPYTEKENPESISNIDDNLEYRVDINGTYIK